MSNDSQTKIRAAVHVNRRKAITRPVYGVPNPDGTLAGEDGTVYPAGDWFASRPAHAEEDGEGGGE